MPAKKGKGEPGFPGLALTLFGECTPGTDPGGAGQPALAAAFSRLMSDFWMQRSFTLALQ